MNIHTAFGRFLNYGDYESALQCLVAMDESDDYKLRECLEKFRKYIRESELTEESLEYYRKSYDLGGHRNFDDFMLALEWNRKPEEQYWLPRRNKLLGVCQLLQDLEDDKLDELFISMPPRTGKTTLIVMFMLWIILRGSERSNLYCSFTESVVKVFFNGLMEILNDEVTYRWKEIFPLKTIASTDAKDLLLNIDRKKRYPSFTGRSLYGTLNGACDCNGYEIADDLHSGIEEAVNKERLNTAWMKVTNNYLPRAKESAKRLWIGTRWSMTDCIARRIDLLENDPKSKHIRYKIVNIPALNENDESNFDYQYGVGFSTEFYQQIRSSFERSDDMASWDAQYMGEPVERSGTLFNPDDFRYFNGILPEGEPDRVFMAVDPAWGGGDYVASPVIYQYDQDLYVVDVVYDNNDKKVSQPNVVNKAIKWGCNAMYVEGTKTTGEYAETVGKMLKERGFRLNLQTSTKHWSGTGKKQRIFDKAPDIKDHMIFVDSGNRSKEYQKFMENVFSFQMGANKQHDDAPDSLSMAISFAYFGDAKVQVLQRPF